MNIAIMGCEQIKDEACIGCQRCLTAMHRREGELERYKDDPNKIFYKRYDHLRFFAVKTELILTVISPIGGGATRATITVAGVER